MTYQAIASKTASNAAPTTSSSNWPLSHNSFHPAHVWPNINPKIPCRAIPLIMHIALHRVQLRDSRSPQKPPSRPLCRCTGRRDSPIFAAKGDRQIHLSPLPKPAQRNRQGRGRGEGVINLYLPIAKERDPAGTPSPPRKLGASPVNGYLSVIICHAGSMRC